MNRSTPLRRTARLRPRSKRTAGVYRARRALVAAVLEDRPRCEVPACTETATDVHEPLTRARGGSILDRANMRAVCRGHHREIHDTEPGWAYRLGFLRHSWDRTTPVPRPGDPGGSA